MKAKIYHNPKCSKSRQALQILADKDCDAEVIEYLKVGLSKDTIKEISKVLSLPVKEFIRTKEDLYKELSVNWDIENEAIEALSSHPKLLERPIVVLGDKAAIGRPVENVLKLIGDCT